MRIYLFIAAIAGGVMQNRENGQQVNIPVPLQIV